MSFQHFCCKLEPWFARSPIWGYEQNYILIETALEHP